MNYAAQWGWNSSIAVSSVIVLVISLDMHKAYIRFAQSNDIKKYPHN